MREPRAGTIARSAAMAAILVYAGAALAEIAGCFSFWAWLRLGKSALWILPGAASLAAFAWLLTRIDADFAGRAYEIGRAHVCTPVTNAHLVCRLLLEKKKTIR